MHRLPTQTASGPLLIIATMLVIAAGISIARIYSIVFCVFYTVAVIAGPFWSTFLALQSILASPGRHKALREERSWKILEFHALSRHIHAMFKPKPDGVTIDEKAVQW